MRSFLSHTMILATCATAGLAWSGCSAKKATEYVAGVSTQMSVPRDLKAIAIDVRVGGAPTYCGGYRVYDGKVQLPRSLGAFAQTEAAVTSGPVMVSVIGYTDDDMANEAIADCRSVIGEGNARILRRSRQPYIPDEIRFIPMPLKYSCYDVNCPGEEDTCKAGKCVPATLTIDQARAQFPLYSPDLVDGTNANCFALDQCMGVAAPAIVVDPDTCTYAVANSKSAPPPLSPLADPFRTPCDNDAECANKSACEILDPGAPVGTKKGRCAALPPGTPWDGVNVEVTYDSGMNTEVLDLDAEEGFFIPDPDPAKSQQFRLAPGLCEMVKGGVDEKGKPSTKHRITAVRASGTCQPKRLSQPLCAADQNKQMDLDGNGVAVGNKPPNDCSSQELMPPRSALMLVVDNTQGNAAFFNEKKLEKLDLPFRDPAFAWTDIGLQYTPGTTACDPAAAPTFAPEPTSKARNDIISSFKTYAEPTANAALPDVPPSLEGALDSAYATLKALPDTYYRRSVIVIGNRDFNADQCPALTGLPADAVKNALRGDEAKPIRTYVLQMTKYPKEQALDAPLTDQVGIDALAREGVKTEAGEVIPNPDGRGENKNAKDAFQQIINTLATCVYEVPYENGFASALPGPADTISFNDPLFGVTTKILPNAACSAENMDGEGWGSVDVPGPTKEVGKKRVFLCKTSCTAYRDVLARASDFSLLYQKPPFAVPLFSHKASCDPK